MFCALRLFLCALACLVFLAAARPAAAQQSQVVVFEDYPPYEYMEDDEVRGINIGIIREAFHRMGVTPVFTTMPWKRGLYELKRGTIAALASGFKTDERMKFAVFPRHYLSLEVNAIFVRTGDGLEVDSLGDLVNKVVGVVREYSYGPEFDGFGGMKLDPVSTNDLLVVKLADRRVDAIAGNQRVIRTLAKRHELKDQIVPVYHLSSEPLYLFFSKALGEQAHSLARRFDQAMDSMEADGTLQKLRAQ